MSGRDRSPRPLHRSQRRAREVRGAIRWFGDELRAARSQLDPDCCWTEEEEREREGGREGEREVRKPWERERESASSCLQQNKTLSKKQLQSGMCL